jgi:Glycosyl transferases group 1
MTPFLHIISFDIPIPTNYGGVIDVFFKIAALKSQGVQIILHNFQYGDRKPNAILEQYCTEVYYYPRENRVWNLFSANPFIVATRNHPKLLKRLQQDNYPILFEGLHSCFYLNYFANCDRQSMLRMHNIEWQYYQNLCDLEPNYFKKIFFKMESIKLKYFEKQVLKQRLTLLTISPDDDAYFRKIHSDTQLILPFHGHECVTTGVGMGKGALFHGKLSVSDNANAALYLIENVFSKTNMAFTIAGQNPPKSLIDKAKQFKNIEIIANPDDKTMANWIQKAHIQILLSFQTAGLKLKLLNALFAGKHCIVNTPMVQNTGLEPLCHIADAPEAMLKWLSELENQPFSTTMIEKRRVILENRFANSMNAKQIVQLMMKRDTNGTNFHEWRYP